MACNINEIAEAIRRMDEQLHNGLLKTDARTQEKASWYKKHREQNDRLNRGDNSVSDHIRAMVYSMLSAERRWEAVEDNKGQIDSIFCHYDPNRLKAESSENLENQVRAISCGNRRISFQMKALRGNIEKLESFEAQSGSVDVYYKKYTGGNGSLKSLVRSLAKKGDKLAELGVPLVSEYLRNVGYDIPKPDRHIKRILGNKILACSKKETAADFEVFDIIAELAKVLDKPAAEIDYILWTYCASGYGAVCTEVDPKCDNCTAKTVCVKHSL